MMTATAALRFILLALVFVGGHGMVPMPEEMMMGEGNGDMMKMMGDKSGDCPYSVQVGTVSVWW